MSIEQYINTLSSERQDAINKLVSIIREKLPKGFHEQMNYGMPSWVVPHSIYTEGYHCTQNFPYHSYQLHQEKIL
mgnify:CR=1 FL=1